MAAQLAIELVTQNACDLIPPSGDPGGANRLGRGA